MESEKLFSILQQHALLDNVEKIKKLSVRQKQRPDIALVELGEVEESAMTEVMAEYLGIPLADTSMFPKDPLYAGGANFSFLRQARILPIIEDDKSLTVAMADPQDQSNLKAIQLLINKTINVQIASKNDLDRAFDRLYPANSDKISPIEIEQQSSPTNEETGPAVKVFDELLDTAINNKASDLHIESTPEGLRSRYRIDGQLIELGNPPQPYLSDMLISRIKILANLNIAENRLPQDGRATIFVSGRTIDIRVSIIPTINGESVVLRLLDPENSPKNLDVLGLNSSDLRALKNLLQNSSGMILTTGPTGSGKTTTLYAILNELNQTAKKIITLEDPVEYRLPGINQIPINSAIGLQFSNLLRSVLRQDPDIIMVGEIRDAETARLAIQSALTGHLVLSSLHTNTATGAISRLIDMGIEPFLIAASVRGVIGQRLVRRLCDNCKQIELATPSEEKAIALKSGTYIARPCGCSNCYQTGYKGRFALMEILNINDAIRECLLQQGNLENVYPLPDSNSLEYNNGVSYVLSHQTSIEEFIGTE
ncbi:MAG: type II secretion system protein GspE [Rhodospirillaceae bacterium]|nr:type II secretion system protein GspE [Rhodospirillaceae bacterium]